MSDSYDLGEARSLVRPKKRVPLARGEKLAYRILREVEPLAEFIMIGGSIRRRRPEIADIDFVALPRDLEAFIKFLDRRGFEGGNRHRVRYVDGVKVEFHIAHKPEELGAHVFMYTGDWLFNVAMRSLAKRRGWKLDQYGLWERSSGAPILQSPSEEDFFGALGVDYHAPEERSFAHRGRHSRRTRAAMGDERTPHDWTPDRRRAIPGIENDFANLGVAWEGVPWRAPDKVEAVHLAVWYGPDGQKGEYATSIEWHGGRPGWSVKEYQPSMAFGAGDDPILMMDMNVSTHLLADAIWTLTGQVVTQEDMRSDPDRFRELAVSLGSALLAHFGPGDSEETVRELP